MRIVLTVLEIPEDFWLTPFCSPLCSPPRMRGSTQDFSEKVLPLELPPKTKCSPPKPLCYPPNFEGEQLPPEDFVLPPQKRGSTILLPPILGGIIEP